MRPIVLTVLDGWGLSPEIKGNAILNTETPNFDYLLSLFPYTSLHASGEEVGLPWGEIGNSEVGHFNLGTGRIVMQDLLRINRTIEDQSFYKNSQILSAFEYAQKSQKNLHLVGLFSSGGVHSHMNHLFALLNLSKQVGFDRVYLHLISDGRDTAPKVFLKDLSKLESFIQANNTGKIASVSGRFWAMDRDKHWDRTEKAFEAISNPNYVKKYSTCRLAVESAYQNSQNDEFIEPSAIENTSTISEGDAVIFYNFRADRSRQLADKISQIPNIYLVSFTSYADEYSNRIKVAFFTPKIENNLAMVLAKERLQQLHIAETEKFAHVTYFFNGGNEQKFQMEERIMVQSPKVLTFDLKPEMSAAEITKQFIDYFNRQRPSFTILNYANPDMVGHTGNFEATKRAIQAVDENLGKLAGFILKNDADLIVTADHGNAEQMINLQTGEVDKEHTTNPVPLILAFNNKKRSIREPISIDTKIGLAARTSVGVLADISATVLGRMSLNIPSEITGQSLEEYI